MSKKEDLTGRRFGRLVAVEKTAQKKRSAYLWRCVCDCGGEKLVEGYQLKNGNVRSCGCLQDASRRKDISGQKRGSLTAICPTDRQKNGQTIWLWRCDCGAVVAYPPEMIGEKKRVTCPACSARIKSGQAASMRSRIHKFYTGCSEKTASQIRSGALTAQNTSGIRGVSWHRAHKAWQARIGEKSVGLYKSLQKAKKARESAVMEKYGDPEDTPSP